MTRRLLISIAVGLLGVLASVGLTTLAVNTGVLFGGLTAFVSLVMATVACWVVAGAIAAIGIRRRRSLGWGALIVITITVSAAVVVYRSWSSIRGSQLKAWNIINPVPNSLHIHRGQDDLFSYWVHFSAPPEVISAIIRSKQLMPPTSQEEKRVEQRSMGGAFNGQDPKWWMPGGMENPRLYLHMHRGPGYWIQGLWVNETMTEAYAFYRG